MSSILGRLVLAVAVAASSAGVSSVAVVDLDEAASAETCVARPNASELSTMLIQVQQRRGEVSSFRSQHLPKKNLLEKKHESKNRRRLRPSALGDNSTLKRILQRARNYSKISKQPFEYLLDVDYLHDANNPLDNGGVDSSSGRETSESSEAAETTEEHSPEVGEEEAVFLENCVTRSDPRVNSGLASVSAPGTRCVFGADERDEGSHCIIEDGIYGSFGWCYTALDKSSWGSCDEGCPLQGRALKLEKRIDAIDDMVSTILNKVRNRSDCEEEEEEEEEIPGESEVMQAPEREEESEPASSEPSEPASSHSSSHSSHTSHSHSHDSHKSESEGGESNHVGVSASGEANVHFATSLPALEQAHSKDLVLALAMGYGPSQAHIFLGTLRRSGFAGDVVLVISNKENDSTKEAMRHYNATLVTADEAKRWEPPNLPSDLRNGREVKWHLGAHVCAEGRYRYCMLTDYRDVFFQSNPFDRYPRGEQLVLNEVNHAHGTIADQQFNREWVQACLGRDFDHEWPAISKRWALCSGTIAGTM